MELIKSLTGLRDKRPKCSTKSNANATTPKAKKIQDQILKEFLFSLLVAVMENIRLKINKSIVVKTANPLNLPNVTRITLRAVKERMKAKTLKSLFTQALASLKILEIFNLFSGIILLLA